MNLHPLSVTLVALISISCLYAVSHAKYIPDYKRADTNYKWFKIDRSGLPNDEAPDIIYNARFQEIPQQAGAYVESDNIPLPLALRILHDKRGMDFGTGRSYSGFQAMRGNLGLAFASPGSHGK